LIERGGFAILRIDQPGKRRIIMDPLLESCFDILASLHEDCRIHLEGLTQRELDARPGRGMNSLAVLAAHIAGAERYWIGDVVMGEDSARNRDSEFETMDESAEALLHRLDASLDYARSAFERLRADELAGIRTSPRDGRRFTAAWAILHTIEHTALHLGHMQIMKQLPASN
jgi:uncharacterized damage-inducible protein DinB